MAARFGFPKISGTSGFDARSFLWAFFVLPGLATTALAQNGAGQGNPVVPAEKWTVLFRGKVSKKRALKPLGNLPVISHKDLRFVGPDPGHPFRLGNFQVDGAWGVRAGHLVRGSGDNAALVLADADEFELEGLVDADGLGGWFILLGWHKGTGYALYNVTLKKSGSPWILTEFKDSNALADEQREVNRYNWKKTQPMWLKVVENKLSLKVGDKIILEDKPLPNYLPGKLMFGTYNTRYGPKNLRVQTLRIRRPPRDLK